MMANRVLLVAAAILCVALAQNPTSANCTVNWYEQTLDHFSWLPGPEGKFTYKQRYFTYDKYWKSDRLDGTSKGPIFFYLGNEADVTLYVNNTGLMWENAESFQALLVFAEHRFYGESVPFPDGTRNCLGTFTTEQAMADYAQLISHLRATLDADDSPIIGFGGSYGGMLSSWFRMKYPSHVDGSIAGSAPIMSFVGLNPPFDYNSFYEIVTRDASAAGGATDMCKDNLSAAWPKIVAAGATSAGLQTLQTAFKTCKPLTGQSDAWNLMYWAQNPWPTLAMGNYPYASSYLLNGAGFLPPWPVRKACSYLAANFTSDADLFAGVRQAASIFYNFTGTMDCFYNGPGATQEPEPSLHTAHFRHHPAHKPKRARSAAASCQGSWNYQYCTEMFMPFTSGVGKDMFYPPSPFNVSATIEGCIQEFNVQSRPLWASIEWGGWRELSAVSNIVFSNGFLDPWSGGGVAKNISGSVQAVLIPNGAHHIDLMFSNPADTPDIVAARQFELAHIQKWITEAHARNDARTEL